MNEWEQNPDAWKGEKETNVWGYENEDGNKVKKNPKVSREIIAYTVGIRPTIPTTLVETVKDIRVKNRDALKLIKTVAEGQKATTKDEELFMFSVRRNMWVRIPWEKP